ncbi:MAG TPA: single-stranded DNA-binding protein [Spirochaetota bacterium]|nr:single-stranded DNA-binding protein [Spirochaetota bacterium]HQE58561.1 single-stranded DNA-binding protein [Spirochaetota bacterium]
MSISNSATVEGFTTNDPVLKHTKTGKNVCNFALTVRHHSEAGGDPKVSFIDIESWGNLADFCSNNIHKGIRLLVSGAMRQDRWEGEDGKSRSRIKLIAKDIRFLDTNKKEKSAVPV